MKNNLRKQVLTVALGLLFCAAGMRAQMSGTYYVPGNFSSLAAAINSLNAVGVSGPVTIEVANNHFETAPVGGYTLTATGTAANPITFQKASGVSSPTLFAYSGGVATPASAITDGVFAVIGGDYITIDGINIIDNNTTNPETMEYGYGFFRASAADGAQHNTVKNCVITLNRVNNTTETQLSSEGSKGIWFATVNYSAQASAAVVATSTAGNNSYNTIQTNTIQNVNIGIVVNCFAYTAANLTSGFADAGNQILGNTIINYGGGGTNSAHGIKTKGQSNITIANNYVYSNNNHAGFLAGIENGAAVSANVSITGNTISLGTQTTATSGNRIGINNLGGATANNNAINIDNNIIQNTTVYGSSSYYLYGIWNQSANSASLSISNNLLSNLTTTYTSATSASSYLYPIYNTGAVTQVISIKSNTAANLYSGYYTYGAICYNTNGVAATTTTNIDNNVATNIVSNYNAYLIYNTGTSYNMSISNNSITGYTVNNIYSTSATLYGLYNTAAATNIVMDNNSVQNVKGYYIMYGIYTSGAGTTKSVSSNLANNWDMGSTLYGFYITGTTSGGLSVLSNTIQNSNVASTTTEYWYYLSGNASPNYTVSNNVWNNISRQSLTQTGASYLYYCTGYPSSGVGYINNNTLTNIDNGAGTLYGIYRGLSTTAGHTVSINNNYLANFQNRTAIYGIYTGVGSLSFVSNNTLTALSSSLAASSLYAIYSGAGPTTGTTNISYNTISNVYNENQYPIGIRTAADNGFLQNIYGNKIYNISSAAYAAAGIYHSGKANIYNNIIGDLYTTTSAGLEFEGIRIADAGTGGTGTNPINIFNNTIKMSGTSLGGISAALLVSPIPGGTVTVNNNILINTSSGPGDKACIYWGATTYTNLVSDRNLFFAGLPGNSNLIFSDGTNAYANLATYQAALAPRDANSVMEANTPFLSTVGSNPNYMHIDPTAFTAAESGGVSLAGIVDMDIDNDIRAGSPGYTGSGTAPDIGADEFNSAVPSCTSAVAGAAVSTMTSACVGTSISFSASGYPQTSGFSYQWRVATASGGPYTNLYTSSSTPPQIAITPTTAGTFYYVLTNTCSTFGSANSNQIVVVVNATPTSSAAASPSVVCEGQGFTLNGSSDIGTSYMWTGPNNFTSTAQNPSIPVTQTVNTGVYSVIASLNGCSSPAATVSVLINELPAVPTTISNSLTVCQGATTATIEATSMVQGSVGPLDPASNGLGGSLTGSATYSTSFDVLQNTTLVSVDIFPTSAVGTTGTIVIVNSSGSVMANVPFTVTVQNTTSPPFIPQTVILNAYLPAGTSYSIRPFGALSLRNPSGAVYPYTSSAINITGNNFGAAYYYNFYNWQFIVGGGVVNWWNAAAGGNTVAINTSSLETVGTSLLPNTNATGTYTFFASANNGCESATRLPITVSVIPGPTLSIVSPTSVCLGGSITLTANGADTYTWNTNATTASIIENPTTATNYTVSGTTINGCQGSATVAIGVTSAPVIAVNSATICEGESALLVATGVDTYTWSTSDQTNSVSVSPTMAGVSVYTVQGNALGCSAVAQETAEVVVNALPVLSPVNNLNTCVGNSLAYTPTLSPSGAGAGYTLTTFIGTSVSLPLAQALAAINMAPAGTYPCTLTAQDSEGCNSNAQQFTVTLNALPTIGVNNPTVCVNEAAVIIPSGAATYTISGGSYTITSSAAGTTDYTVSGTDNNGCENSSIATIVVSDCVGIGELKSESLDLKIYPNPNNGNFTVEVAENTRIIVMNSLGQVIHEETTSTDKTEVSIAEMANGIYFVRVISNDKQQTVRVVKQQ